MESVHCNVHCDGYAMQMAFMLPGIAPTHKKVCIPLIVVVQFEGEKLASERIYWDQASVLAQIGVLDPSLLPGQAISGQEQAAKVLNFDSLPSNKAIELAHQQR